jgi:hypothetical protein
VTDSEESWQVLNARQVNAPASTHGEDGALLPTARFTPGEQLEYSDEELEEMDEDLGTSESSLPPLDLDF